MTPSSRFGIWLLSTLACALTPVAASALATPNSFTASHRVIDYLQTRRDIGRIVSGQQNKIINGARGDEDMQHVYDITSPQVYPAMAGFDIGCVSAYMASNGISMATVRADMTATAIDYWEIGAFITYSWHQTSPKDANPDVGGIGSVQGAMTNAEFHDVVTPGTVLHTRWLNHVDLIAPYLKQLRDAGVVVLWRPYHEMNGGWFWWGARPGADYVQLWRNLYDRLVNYHGLNNLIWVWTPSDTSTGISPFYPGAAYVDISGVDIYTWSTNVTYLNYPSTLTSAAPGKPYTLAECGLFPTTSSIDARDYLWFLCWHGVLLDKNWATPGYPADPGNNNANSAATTQAFYNHAAVLTLDEISLPRTSEAELLVNRVFGATSVVPYVWPGGGNGAIAVFQGDSAGDSMEFDVQVPAPGLYSISAALSRKNNRPLVALTVGGSTVGSTIDLYTASVDPVFSTVTFGTFNFTTAGTKTLRFTATSKHASSLGYLFAVDSIELTPVLQADAFETGTGAWTTSGGTWAVTADVDGNKRYTQSSLTAGNTMSFLSPTYTNLILSADVTVTGTGTGGSGAGIAFRATDANNYYYWKLHLPEQELRLIKVVGGVGTQIGASVPFPVVNNTAYNLRVVASGTTINCYASGGSLPVLSVTDSTFASGKAAVRAYLTGAKFDNVAVLRP